MRLRTRSLLVFAWMDVAAAVLSLLLYSSYGRAPIKAPIFGPGFAWLALIFGLLGLYTYWRFWLERPLAGTITAEKVEEGEIPDAVEVRPAGLAFEGSPVHIGDWIITHEDGAKQLMTPQEFRRAFAPINSKGLIGRITAWQVLVLLVFIANAFHVLTHFK